MKLPDERIPTWLTIIFALTPWVMFTALMYQEKERLLEQIVREMNNKQCSQESST